MSSKRYILCFLLMLSCVCAAWSQENEQMEIPLVFSGSMGVVIDPTWITLGSVAAEATQEDGNAGRYCLRVATTERAALSHRVHVLEKGKVYTLAAYLRSPDRLRINLSLHLTEEPWTGYGEQPFTMTDTWQEYHVTTPPMPEDVSRAGVYFRFPYDTGEFYIDSVRFYEGEYVPYEPVAVGHIEGTLTMLDDKTPHVAVVVQAIRDGKSEATVLSDEAGKYQLINLKPGRYELRCQVLGGYVYYGEEKAREPGSHKAGGSGDRTMLDEPRLRVEQGETLKNIDFRFAPFKKGIWRTYNYLDGLAGSLVSSIHRDPDGVMWFASTGGFSRYDGKEFVKFTSKDGLVPGDVLSMCADQDGILWFGTRYGVSRYDGKEFVNFTTEGGLGRKTVRAIHCDPDGVMWFGTTLGGVSRYDGKTFVNFTTEDGLAHNDVQAIHCDPDGVMWFGTRAGLSRYDRKEFVKFTTKDGLANDWIRTVHRDPDGVLWIGTGFGGLSRYDGKEFVNFTMGDGLADKDVRAIHRDPDGVMWFGTRDGLSRYDGRTFVNFTTEDGLASNSVWAIYRDPDGVLWFGTNGGVSQYDGKTFASFTTKDGLADNRVGSIHCNPDGVLWLGTFRGVSRYDATQFANFTTKDGLAVIYSVRAIDCDLDGVMWFGGTWGGVSRYDGKEFINFSTGHGLAYDEVQAIYCDPDGVTWFGTEGGVSCYDGKEFVNFTTEDGLASNSVWAIHRDPDGVMWFGAMGGVSRYNSRGMGDSPHFVNFTEEDGLVSNWVNAICGDPDGVMWFGTRDGVSRYDGKGFVNYTTEDGLASSGVSAIHCDSDGVMWFGTGDGGASGYDGEAWTSLDTRDGLPGTGVNSILQDSDGFLWFATEGGVTRYRRNTIPPKAYMVSVTADRTYRDLSAIPALNPGTRVTIEYSSIDFRTVPEKRQYRYRVCETGDVRREKSDFRHQTSDREVESQVSSLKSDVPYNPPTRKTTFDWTPEKPGTYTFQVQAIDRDLNYSEPASLVLSVVPPFYLRAVFLIPTIGSGTILLAALVIVTTALTKRRRQVHAYQQLAVRELQDAREMQMALLPEAAPPVEGMEIAGRSIPANTVGGDFFDYITLADGRVGIALADISGKGLRAAMNAVMTSGMLYEVVKTEMSCGNILSALNAGLYPRMEKQTFAAFSFAILDQDAGVIQWSNAAQPLPMIKRSDGVSEAEAGGGLPLGMAPDVKYPDHQLELQTGDIVVLYTDGIIEAENEAEEMYGTERLLNFVAGIDSAASVEDVMEAILQDVARFVGSAEQYDDMTIVAAKKVR